MPSQSYFFEGTMTALSSITHFGDSTGGTEQVLRREKVIQPGGGYVEVPVISGNSWRGQLRDCGMRAMLYEMGRILGHDITLSAPAFHLLFSGGALTKDSGRGLDIQMARRLRGMIPLLAVLGGAVGRQILDGKAQIGQIVPVCVENAARLPESLASHPNARISIYDFLSIEHYTRMDDTKRETLAGAFLPPAEQVLLEAPKVKTVKNKKTGEDEEVAESPGVATQMRYGFEVFSAGTVFAVSVALNYVTALEFEAFMAALREWSRTSIIGGRAASGLGRVRLEFPGWKQADPRLMPDATAVGQPFGALYREHLERESGAILAALEALA